MYGVRVCVLRTFFLHFEMLFLLHCYLVTVKQNEIDIGKIDEDFRITFTYTIHTFLLFPTARHQHQEQGKKRRPNKYDKVFCVNGKWE